MKVLVTGATGYVGSRLIPELLRRGHVVVATHTSDTPKPAPWQEQVTWRQMNVLDPQHALDVITGVDAVVYLIHGMEGSDFRSTDRAAAENVRAAVDQAGVGRLVYLSGVIPDVPESELSEHLVSRLEVERELTLSTASTLALRAAVIIGSGSTSFEIIRQISQRLPLVQTIPTWMRDTTVQPIAIADVVHLLVDALEQPNVRGHMDIGGPDRVTYPELLTMYADAADLTRVQVAVPAMPAELTGWLAARLTDVPTVTVEALMSSLRHDMVTQAGDTASLGYTPRVSLQQALDRANASYDPTRDGAAVGQDPGAPSAMDPAWSH